MTSPIGFDIALTNIEATLIQRFINIVQRCFDVVSCRELTLYQIK